MLRWKDYKASINEHLEVYTALEISLQEAEEQNLKERDLKVLAVIGVTEFVLSAMIYYRKPIKQKLSEWYNQIKTILLGEEVTSNQNDISLENAMNLQEIGPALLGSDDNDALDASVSV